MAETHIYYHGVEETRPKKSNWPVAVLLTSPLWIGVILIMYALSENRPFVWLVMCISFGVIALGWLLLIYIREEYGTILKKKKNRKKYVSPCGIDDDGNYTFDGVKV